MEGLSCLVLHRDSVLFMQLLLMLLYADEVGIASRSSEAVTGTIKVFGYFWRCIALEFDQKENHMMSVEKPEQIEMPKALKNRVIPRLRVSTRDWILLLENN